MSITFDERQWWRIALELRLRQLSGQAFQTFFSDVMRAAYGTDFVPVRPFGTLGDSGCDGFRTSTGQVYQCYGALNGNAPRVNSLTTKMVEDFSKAKTNLSSIMKSWSLVHNLIDGLPVEALTTLGSLKASAGKIHLDIFGLESFENLVLSLEREKIAALLGDIPSSGDARDLSIAELRNVVRQIADDVDSTTQDVEPLRPVPVDKLQFNKIPGAWQFLIKGGWKNVHLVSDYFAQHPEPLLGKRVARQLHTRYKYLTSQNLPPGDIMSSLYEFSLGIKAGPITPSRMVAAQALLAFHFESCDIFEDKPKVAAE